MPRKHRRNQVGQLDDLNLAPIMSILVILIPMLIFAFSFFKVTVQSVAAPKMGKPQAKKKKDEEPKKPLNLTVLISEKQFQIKYDDETMSAEGEAPIKRREFPPDSVHGDQPYWDYDYATLHNRLALLKEKFPDEQQINIGAEMHIPWHIIARTIDAVRVKLDGTPFEGDERMLVFQKAKPKKVKGEVELLFPNVVFVVAE